MAAIADIELPTRETGLEGVFTGTPALTCEMEQVIVSNSRSLWFAGGTRSEIEDTLEEGPGIDAYTYLSRRDDRFLFNVSFGDEFVDVFTMVVDHESTVLEASASDGSWRLRVRFPDRERVSEFYNELRSQGLSPTVVRLFDLDREMHTRCGLTTEQYETLVAAIDHGYFEIPREVSMQELSDELGISHQALSERLRRAYRALVASELNVTDERRSAPSIPSD